MEAERPWWRASSGKPVRRYRGWRPGLPAAAHGHRPGLDYPAIRQSSVGGGTHADANGNPFLAPADSSADLALVSQLVLQTCDALDGLADGMVFNAAACGKAFSPAALSQLECPGAKTAICLTHDQVVALRNVFAGPVDSRDHPLYSAFPYGVGISDPKWMLVTLGYPGFDSGTAQNITQGASSMMYLFSRRQIP